MSDTSQTLETPVIPPAAGVQAAATGGDTSVQGAAAPASPSATTTSASAAPAPGDVAGGWNGELTHLNQQEWFSKLDEGTRKAVEAGIKAKYTNLEGGYSRKFQETATARKQWEAKEKQLSSRIETLERESQLYTDIFGQGSPEAKDVDAKLAKLRDEYKAKYDPLEQEVMSLRAYKEETEAGKKSAYEKEVQQHATRMQEEYKDIFESDPASDYFEKLLRADFEEKEAVELTRAKFQLEPPRLPGAARHASRGDSPAMVERLPFQRISSNDLIERAVEQAARQRGVG